MSANISLDNTPHPSVKHCSDKVNARYRHGRPDSELVPSRYALKVGAIDVMVVSDGVLSLARRDVGPQRRSGRPGGFRWVPGSWEY